uniref:Carboxypeptidase regulatory-like domain-containing protein n=1 Tax=candidate division WOR-3 bacterium TaxID=2052148 RepID=A0A7V3UZ77_UNCW3
MKRAMGLMSIILVAGLVFAGTGGISGKVTNLITGEPVVNAIVVACSDSLPAGRAQTDEQGNYLISGLEPGKYQVIARARGYVPAHYPRAVIVQEGQITTDINLALRPIERHTGAISGRVINLITREPIRNATVIIYNQGFRKRARTDRNGYYLCRGLRPGTYRVSAKAYHYFAETYPEPVVIQEHQVTENINFALTPKPRKGGIAGQVLNSETGYPIAGVLITVRSADGQHTSRTDRHGFYLVWGLNPGNYEVSAYKPGYLPETYPEPVSVIPAQITRGIDFRLQPMTRKTE